MALYVNIKKTLGAFCLDVSFEIGEDIMAILGTSGCGKSMTLKCIAGIEKPDRGQIILNGRTLFDSEKKINLPPQQRRVGYMFQDYALFPNMTVAGNIAAGIREKDKALREAMVREYMRRFHVAELENHYPSQLSGGQKQRVAMARMLASEPELIMLDEPFSALDAHLKWALEQEVRETLHRVGRTCLFVSHSRDEVYRLSELVGVMDAGHMDHVKPVRQLFEAPQTRTAAILSGCRNITPARRLSEHALEIPGWGLSLRLERDIPEDIAWVGIRAHYFRIAEESIGNRGSIDNVENREHGKNIEDRENTAPGESRAHGAHGLHREEAQAEASSALSALILLPVCQAVPTEEPFEWNVAFTCGQGLERIHWRVSKDIWNYRGEDDLPRMLCAEQKDLLLLR